MIDEAEYSTGPAISFIDTKEYKRFIEFVEACRDYRYIGICYGEPGVGKSVAALNYLKWHEEISTTDLVSPVPLHMMEKINNCKGVLITAPVINTPKIMNNNIVRRVESFGWAYDKDRGEMDCSKLYYKSPKLCHLVVVDEADRLMINSLEQIRDIYDQYNFGLVLIGMPGIEKRLSRYPQLYSKIGFSHQYHKLSQDEIRFILDKLWKEIGLDLSVERFSDVEAINTFIRITDGNFRLIDRMFSQISRILQINDLKYISKDVIDAARQCLVIGHNGY